MEFFLSRAQNVHHERALVRHSLLWGHFHFILAFHHYTMEFSFYAGNFCFILELQLENGISEFHFDPALSPLGHHTLLLDIRCDRTAWTLHL